MNLDRLKQFIKQRPKLECIYMCIQALRNEELSKEIVGIKRNPYNIIMQELGTNRPKENIYYINFNNGYEFNGFCSLFRFVLCHLAFADDINMKPVVNWGKSILYYDETINETNNAFEYFFNPVSDISANEVLSCKHVIISKGSDANAFGTTTSYIIPNEEIAFLGGIMKKYITLKKEIYNIINPQFYQNGKTLGVHVRATDFNVGYNRHPKVVTPQEYLKNTKEAFDKFGFEKVFLATDDNSVIELFKESFGNNLYYYEETFRSTNGEAIHYGNHRVNREHHKFNLGVEIIKDFFTLGKCDGLIAGNSNVSVCARIVKASTGTNYNYLNIIDKGINHNLRETRLLFNPMVKK